MHLGNVLIGKPWRFRPFIIKYVGKDIKLQLPFVSKTKGSCGGGPLLLDVLRYRLSGFGPNLSPASHHATLSYSWCLSVPNVSAFICHHHQKSVSHMLPGGNVIFHCCKP